MHDTLEQSNYTLQQTIHANKMTQRLIMEAIVNKVGVEIKQESKPVFQTK